MNVPFSNWLLLIDKKAIDFFTLILDELKLFRIVFNLLFSDFSLTYRTDDINTLVPRTPLCVFFHSCSGLTAELGLWNHKMVVTVVLALSPSLMSIDDHSPTKVKHSLSSSLDICQ